MKFRTKLLTALPLTLLAACGGGGGHSGAGHAALEYGDSFTVLMVDLSSALLVPSVDGAVTGWSIDPQLPDGLNFDLATGEISGTPHASSPRTLYTVRANYSFTTKMFLDAFTQYDAEGHLFNANVRFNLIHHPLSDVFIVFNEQRLTPPDQPDIRPGRSVVIKVTQSLAF